jgi:hypothetical protein
LRPLQDKFDELETLLLHHRDTLAQNTGVPFLRLVYRPEEEEACRHRRETLARVLERQGIRVATVSCKGAIFAHYERQGRLERLFELEQTESDWLQRRMGPHARKEMVDRLLQAADPLAGDGILFVVDTAFAYPYLSLAGVLHDVTNRITSPMALVLFYPGEVSVDGKLLLLGRRASGTYRTRDLV